MSRSRNESSVPNQRGRKQNLKVKRLGSKRVRNLPIETDELTIKRVKKSVKLDK
jgi:hypothetical protein